MLKLEELPGALIELKEKLLTHISENCAGEANEHLLTELRKRLMSKPPRTAKTKESQQKPTAKKLNDQQSKFLKSIPVMDEPDDDEIKPTSDSIQLQKSGIGYVIGIDSELPNQVKNLAKATDADREKYLNILTENAIKQLDQLL